MLNKNQIASNLLKINAVTLSPKKPYAWSSGMKSPIYTDNRQILGYPKFRRQIEDCLAKTIKENYPQANAIAGVATAGIAHAALVSERLNLPMIYVRSKPKDHGLGRQIEGHLPNHAKIVVIDDLISTGKSALNAARAINKREPDAKVIGIIAIFTYKLVDSTKNFRAMKMSLKTLTNYPTLIQQATDEHIITPTDHNLLAKWRTDPWHWLNK
ncbi:orotate phosphoribosyltransferase [uncultured bacterium]|nr:orotate phosphoribosyltransferase [uncultured bacterium]